MAESFTLDTSGVVLLPWPSKADPAGRHASDPTRWSDLTPFAQGYIEAAKQSFRLAKGGCPGQRYLDWSFSNLAPATLARILKDCDRAQAEYGGSLRPDLSDHAKGAALWKAQQDGAFPNAFPPLTFHPGDDGLIYFGEV